MVLLGYLFYSSCQLTIISDNELWK